MTSTVDDHKEESLDSWLSYAASEQSPIAKAKVGEVRKAEQSFHAGYRRGRDASQREIMDLDKENIALHGKCATLLGQLRAILRDVPSVTCESFFHHRHEQHDPMCEACLPYNRFKAAIEAAEQWFVDEQEDL